MPKKAILTLADGFEEIEAVTCIDILRRAGIQTTIAGLNNLEVCGSRKLKIKADVVLKDIEPEYDACVLPGGMPGAKNLSESEKVISLIKKMNKNNKVVAAICASPAIVLKTSGILNGKTATCYPEMEEKFGPEIKYKEDKVVVDNNIITSQGPATALAFALKISEKLLGKELSKKVEKATLAN